MSYRFTNTEKWQDNWFSNLTQLQMLLFIYLCDNCDIAGFVELNLKRFAADLNSTKDTIEGALKGLDRGLIYSKTNDCIYIRNFIKHQKNLPLNLNNKAHLGIIKRFEIYTEKFDIQDINIFIEGASKGLRSPTGNGIGIGNGISNSIGIKKEKENQNFNFKEDLIIYGFSENLVEEWIEIRKKKKLTNTETVSKKFKKEVEKVLLKYPTATKDHVLEKIIYKGWGGFDATWIDNEVEKAKQNNNQTVSHKNEGSNMKYGIEWLNNGY